MRERSTFRPVPGLPTGPWSSSPGSYIAGSAAIDGMDAVAREMEERWGVDRLRLLVSTELREKFDRQRYLVNQAIWHGQLEDVQSQAERMVKAWKALDAAATTAGAKVMSPQMWEIGLPDGRVLAIVQTGAEASAAARTAEGRSMVVWTMEEVAAMVVSLASVNAVKSAFPGATVTSVRRSIGDPLDRLEDTRLKFSDGIPF